MEEPKEELISCLKVIPKITISLHLKVIMNTYLLVVDKKIDYSNRHSSIQSTASKHRQSLDFQSANYLRNYRYLALESQVLHH
jgi:hypothetical protein